VGSSARASRESEAATAARTRVAAAASTSGDTTSPSGTRAASTRIATRRGTDSTPDTDRLGGECKLCAPERRFRAVDQQRAPAAHREELTRFREPST
jgi:hypothetical protein